jgi:PAS domain S-box-containing protein
MVRRIDLLRVCSRILFGIVFTSALAVLVGWQFNIEVMKVGIIGAAPMNPMTALLFVLIAGIVALVPPRHPLTLIMATVVLLVSLYHVTQIFTGFSLYIDFSQWSYKGQVINPMAPITAVFFILTALSVLLDYFKRSALESQTVLIATLIGELFMITGYIFQVPEFNSSIRLFPALQTCILLQMVTTAILFSRPEEGLIKLLVGDWEGSRIGRWLIPLAIFIPFIIAYLRILLEKAAFISPELGVSIVVLSYLLIFSFNIFFIATSINIREYRRQNFINEINLLNHELKESNDDQLVLNEELAASNEEINATVEQLRLALDKIKLQDEIIIQQKEAALQTSQQYIEIIFSNTKEEIVLLDLEGRIILFNNSLQEFILKATGKKPENGMYLWDMTLPSRREESMKLFRCAVGGTAVSVEVTVKFQEEEATHYLQYEPVFVDGEVKYVSLISIDVTEQKRKEEQLQRSESNLKAIFDSTDDLFTLLSPDYKIMSFNKSNFNNAFKVFGKGLAIGESMLDFVTDDRKPIFVEWLRRARAGEKVVYHHELPSTKAWLKVTITPVITKEGEFIGYCVTSADETAIHNAEIELKLKEERFRGLVEHSKDIFLIVSQGKITYVSSNVSELLGYSPNEFTEFQLDDLIDERNFRLDWDSLNEEGASQVFECRIRHKNNQWLWIEGFCVNLVNVKSLDGIVFTLRDCTEKKAGEEKLKNHLEELEKTNYELDHFVYSVSHDLRAPLSSILGLINVAELEGKDYESPYFGMIKGRINHLDGFIRNILDYSRNSRTEPRSEPIDFKRLIDDAKANMKLVNGFDWLTIDYELNLMQPFYSDYTRMGIIVSNLISNSIKFQDRRKPKSTLSIFVTTTKARAEIIVKDNGIGIAEEHIKKVFEMFYRASELSTGSGLGLYIVKETVAKLHGTINIKSRLGEYTIFEIILPNGI